MHQRILAVGAMLWLLAAPVHAQPGGPSGLPDPAVIAKADSFKPPRLADYAAKLASQPDFTGAWKPLDPAGAGPGPIFDPEHTVWAGRLTPGESGFGPLPGTYIKGIPYKPEYRKKYEALVKETTEGKSRDTFAACVPFGTPRMIGATPTPFDIVQAPEIIDWNNNYGRSQRRIFLDGRPHPAPDAMEPTYSGHSIGHWEGDTLVVDTVNFIGGYFDETPAPYSDQLHMVERIRLIDTNILEDQMTLTDPVMMEKPWVVTRYYLRTVGGGPGSGAPPPSFGPGSGPPQGMGPPPGFGPGSGPPPPGFGPGSGPPQGMGPPPNASPFVQGGGRIVRDFFELNDRPCVPNVRMDENGFQVMLLPAEIEAEAEAAKAKGKTK